MKRYAIILAGGSGTRMGTDTPKQFLLLNKKPILLRTLETFHKFDPTIKLIVVLPYEQREQWNDLLQRHRCNVTHEVVVGGNERFYSAQAGVIRAKRTAMPEDIIAIHDGVRPLVSAETLQRCYEGAMAEGSAIACMPMVESLRQVDENGSYAVDRSQFVSIQTPQAFRADTIIASYKMPFRDTFTDDASVVEAAGFPIHLVEGNVENIKITKPIDLLTAEALLAQRRPLGKNNNHAKK